MPDGPVSAPTSPAGADIESRELTVLTDDGVTLSGEEAGAGPAVVLLHGVTGTRRYVVMGSRSLERSGHRVIAYDARGHGRSTPASDPRAYDYGRLSRDLAAVLDATGIAHAVLAGVSMGCHTIAHFALEHPGRVAALAFITPAFPPQLAPGDAARRDALAYWDGLAEGLREGGVEGFLRAYDLAAVAPEWRATVETVLRQRMDLHEHPQAVADALEVVPRSRPFGDISELARIQVPTIVIANRDQADPLHPLAVGERWASTIPGARLYVEDEGQSPLSWQGGRVSRMLAELVERSELAR